MGVSVEMKVSVGVKVSVTVWVIVGMAVALGSLPVPFRAMNNETAPMMRNKANKPSAAGRLKVNCGIRAPWMLLSTFAVGFGVALKTLPQTTHREAFSARRVPQVGHSFVGVVSGLITWRLYHDGD